MPDSLQMGASLLASLSAPPPRKMPIKQKKSSRDKRQPSERPSWNDDSQAVPGESADARLQRMSMQMASAERSGFRGERSDLYGGHPIAVVWAIRITTAIVVIGGIFAVTTLFKGSDSSEQEPSSESDDAIAALIRAAREEPKEDVSVSDTAEKIVENHYEWLSTSEEAFAPFQETVLSFFKASTPIERMPFVIQTPDIEKRLNDSAGEALFDQISAPTFAQSYCLGKGWVTVDVLLPSFGFRPVIINTSEDKNRIDLDAFIGYNPKTSEEIKKDLKSGQQATFHALVTRSPKAAETPGDVLLIVRDPNDTLLIGEPIIAQLSKFGSAPEHIVSWLSNGQPLPFTITITPEISLTGDPIFRISEIHADAWSSGLTSTPVALAPPRKTIGINAK